MAECVTSATGRSSLGKAARGRHAHRVDPVPELGAWIVARLALGLVGHQQLEHHLARLLGALARRLHLHAGGGLALAGGGQHALALHLDHAGAAVAVGAIAGCRMPAQVRDLGAVPLRPPARWSRRPRPRPRVRRASKVILVIGARLQLFSSISTNAILEGVGVDDVVMHAGLAEVGDALLQLGEALLALRGHELQPAVRHRHHHVVHLVHVLACLGPRRKSPLGDPHPLVVDLHRCHAFG